MNYYGQHEQEQAMQAFIHDSNAAINAIERQRKRLAELLVKSGDTNVDKRELWDIHSSLNGGRLWLISTIDKYLKKWEKFPEPSE